MKKYLIILVCVLLCGCVSTKKVRNQSLEVAKFDTTNFNGNYANKADSAKHLDSYRLFGQLFPKRFPYKFLENDSIADNSMINFHFDNKKTLIITAIENEKILGKIRLKGKVKGNYFSVRREIFLIPIPFYSFYEETKILLANDKSGKLVLKIGNNNTIWILIIGGTKYISQSQFRKIK